ncbi:MAG: prepilin-type N-terminal cleavage/methylation domain-containing protein [Elusimicrobiaceae bacterium]|nr:prepilin-type N-terminal cleavage/methylation domain-containing protein [Elusimicrobiaceae bacterium]
MKKGFTLIELLVVVLIIGILSAVALPQYRKAVLKAKASQLHVLVKHFKDICEMDKLAGGTCAKLEDMGFGYSLENNQSFGETEQFIYDKFMIQHVGENFTAYLDDADGLFVHTNTRNVYCGGSNTMAETICKSMSGSATPSFVQNSVNYYVFK